MSGGAQEGGRTVLARMAEGVDCLVNALPQAKIGELQDCYQ